jgi:hypothetical protein
MRLGRSDRNAYDVIASDSAEQDLSEKPGPLFRILLQNTFRLDCIVIACELLV